MKPIWKIMGERTERIRNDPFYRHNLAMRDERNFDHDIPEPTKEIIERHVVEDGQQIKASLLNLEKKLIKHIEQTKRPDTFWG